jgi:5-methylcytosine-specific restriction endonuclease McrA
MFQSHKLRKRLIAAGVFDRICANCGLAEWLGQKVPLELDHIDGDRANHEISNLRLLCPNCHAQTATYRGKNIRRRSAPRLEQPRACYFKLPV